jgi:hypothetical protein
VWALFSCQHRGSARVSEARSLVWSEGGEGIISNYLTEICPNLRHLGMAGR